MHRPSSFSLGEYEGMQIPLEAFKRTVQGYHSNKQWSQTVGLWGLRRFVPEYGMLIARVLVTPTRIVCLAPEANFLQNGTLQNHWDLDFMSALRPVALHHDVGKTNSCSW